MRLRAQGFEAPGDSVVAFAARLSSSPLSCWPGIYWGYMGIMEKKMETIGILGVKEGLCRDYPGL